MLRVIALFTGIFVGICTTAAAQNVRITENTPDSRFTIENNNFEIARIQDEDHQLTGEFTKTSRACPPFCITPMTIAPGVTTVGEIEVIEYLENVVSAGRGLLLDSRVPEWFAKGTIPGAINLPFTTLDPANPYRDDILRALGGRKSGENWDFSAAMSLMLFCNGPWCDQSPRAARALLDAGFPPQKLFYYRGGMQVWQTLGLTLSVK